MLIRHCAQLETTTPQDVTSAAVYTLRLLARRILALTEEVHDLEQRLTDTITSHTPMLLTHRGVGPDTAAALLIAAGDNRDRLRNEASFAALCGVSPQQASSGRTTRHRLNRGVTDKPTPRCTASPYPACAGMPVPATTSPAASPKARPVAKPSAASSDTSPARSTRSSRHHTNRSPQQLDIHRGISPASMSRNHCRPSATAGGN
jgi:transposase